MNDGEARRQFEERKAKADAEFERKRQSREQKYKLLLLRFEAKKSAVATNRALDSLQTGARQLTQINNRPAEKLITGKAKRMKKRGIGGPTL